MRLQFLRGAVDFFPALQVIQHRFGLRHYFTDLLFVPPLRRNVAQQIQSVLDARWPGEGRRFRTRWRLADSVPCVQPEVASLVFLSAAARARIVPARPAHKLSTEIGPTNLAGNPNFEKLIPRYSRVILTNRDFYFPLSPLELHLSPSCETCYTNLMKTITIRDLRQRWPEAEAALQIEEEIIITRDSKPV